MPGAPSQTFEQASTWLPDLFAWLYDQVTPATQTIISAGWDCEYFAEEDAIVATLEQSVDGAVPGAVLAYLHGNEPIGWGRCSVTSSDANLRRFLVARCIDDACAAVRPGHLVAAPPPYLVQIRIQYLATGSFCRAAPGWVLPKPPLSPLILREDGPRASASGDTPRNLYCNLLRFRDDGLTPFLLDVRRVARRDDFDEGELGPDRRPRVAVVPCAEEHGDIEFTSRLHGSPRLDASVAQVAERRMIEQAGALITRLADASVALALLPELAVTGAVVSALSSALKSLRRANPDASLRWVIAGSGPSDEVDPQSGLRFNQCVVLGATGKAIWRQRKLNHYAMHPDAMKRYGLDDLVIDARDHVEDMHTCSRVCIRDSVLGRVVVLICEDLAQPRPGEIVMDGLRPDWVFTPVLDGELLVGRWGHQRAWQNAARFEANALIATSLVLPRRQDPAQMAFSVGLCVSADASRRVHQLNVDLESDARPLLAWVEWNPDSWPEISIVEAPIM